MVKITFVIFTVWVTISQNLMAQSSTITIGRGTGSGLNNVVVGDTALPSNTTGMHNTAIGNFTLRANTAGSYNNAFGVYSLWKNTTGIHNIGVGASSLTFNTTGAYNTALGSSSLYQNLAGSNNTGVGYWSLTNNTSGSENTALGVMALQNNTTGSKNIALGKQALSENTAGSFNVGIGYYAQPNDNTSDGQLSIQNIIYGVNNTGSGTNISTGNIGIGIKNPVEKLEVNGKIKATGLILNASSGNGKILTSDASGNATWQNPQITVDSTFAKNNLTATGDRTHSWRNLYSFKMDSVVKTTFVNDTFELRKLTTGSPTFFRGNLMNASNDIIDGFLILRGSISNGDTTTYSKSVNAFDAVGINLNFYIVNGPNNLVVERRPELLMPDTVFIAVGHGNLPNATWHIDFFGYNAWGSVTLHDNYLNTNTPISTTSTVSYTFTTDQNAGSKGNRFVLYFAPSRQPSKSLKVIISGMDSLVGSAPKTMLVMDGDTLKKAAFSINDTLSLTTNGTHGVATYTGGVLNIPNYRADSSWATTNSGADIYNNNAGNIGIGTQTPNENAKLDVNGNIFTSGKIAIGETSLSKIGTYSLAVNGSALFNKAVVKLNSTWPDYVFDTDYKLPKLQEIEDFIKVNKHLPDVPIASDIAEKGIDLGNNATILLKKIEELTLFIIDQNKKVEQIKQTIKKQNQDIDCLQSMINELRSKK